MNAYITRRRGAAIVPSSPPDNRFARHIADLCTTHGITLLHRTGYGGWASKRTRTICVRPVKTERTYVVALHEIGHIVGKGRSGTRLEQEAAAWEFVMEQTMVPLAPATYGRMQVYLESYLHRAARRRRMTIPPPGHPFWATYQRIRQRAGCS